MLVNLCLGYQPVWWSWNSGSDTPNQVGIYGTKGISSPLNNPGSRYYSSSWTDSEDNLWLFGGYGRDDGYSSLSK